MTPAEIQTIVLEESRGRFRRLLKSEAYCISGDPADDSFQTRDINCFMISMVAEWDDFMQFVAGCERRGLTVNFVYYNYGNVADLYLFEVQCRDARPQQGDF